jgi:hypothetical protein
MFADHICCRKCRIILATAQLSRRPCPISAFSFEFSAHLSVRRNECRMKRNAEVEFAAW